jgi:hypothetical protein
MVEAFIESAEYRQRFGGGPSGNQEAPEVTAGVKQNWDPFGKATNVFSYTWLTSLWLLG